MNAKYTLLIDCAKEETQTVIPTETTSFLVPILVLTLVVVIILILVFVFIFIAYKKRQKEKSPQKKVVPKTVQSTDSLFTGIFNDIK